MAKYIVVTGGVVSGIGKGITTASLGLILKSSGFSVDAIKFDPYLNVDPGTMSPYEHGEVYVLDDGSETDLDLGHYERFLDVNLTKNSSVTAGKIYNRITQMEREGRFLGKTIQVIPHVTGHIQDCFKADIENQDNHIRLIEIGGSTGDIEAEVFIESFRQFRAKYKKDVLHVHLGYVPFLKNLGEYKTKPLQTSIRELLSKGVQPDIVVARYSPESGQKLTREVEAKLALFSGLEASHVWSLPDLDSIYSVPKFLIENTQVRPILANFTGSQVDNNLSRFFNFTTQKEHQIKIAMVAKYSKLEDAYLSLYESLKIAGMQASASVSIELVDSQKLEQKDNLEWAKLKSVDGVIIPGGFGNRGMEGKILAARYARENQIPFLGICLGLQMAIIEFARSVSGLKARSREMDETGEVSDTVYLVDYIPEQKDIHIKGGSMRLGGYDCLLEEKSLAHKLYAKKNIRERHRHRLEIQQDNLDLLASQGLKVSGKHFYKNKQGEDRFLVEIMELDTSIHPYFIATQSHPEFLSRPDKPHPLFLGLINSAITSQRSKEYN
jgi:CTP synthase